MQQLADRVGGLTGEQFDVVHADPAQHIQFLGQISAEPGGDGEPLPYRAAGWHRGQAVSCECLLHLGVGVQGSDELDLGGPPRGGRATYAAGEALVVGGAEHHAAGHAEELADFAGGSPARRYMSARTSQFDREPVFPVEPSSGSQLDAVSAASPRTDGEPLRRWTSWYVADY